MPRGAKKDYRHVGSDNESDDDDSFDSFEDKHSHKSKGSSVCSMKKVFPWAVIGLLVLLNVFTLVIMITTIESARGGAEMMGIARAGSDAITEFSTDPEGPVVGFTGVMASVKQARLPEIIASLAVQIDRSMSGAQESGVADIVANLVNATAQANALLSSVAPEDVHTALASMLNATSESDEFMRRLLGK